LSRDETAAMMRRMDDRAWLERIDQRMDESRTATEHLVQAVADLRLALNQMNLRQERITGQVLAQLRQLTKETEAETETIIAWRYEGVEEARAQRAALFAILDELKRRPGPATA